MSAATVQLLAASTVVRDVTKVLAVVALVALNAYLLVDLVARRRGANANAWISKASDDVGRDVARTGGNLLLLPATGGRALGRWWRSLSPVTRNLVVLAFIVFLYKLPDWQIWPLKTEADFVSLLAGSILPFVIVALGLNVVVGMAGLLDLGYVGFYAVGAYTLGILTSRHANWPWFIAIVVCIAVSMISGVILGAPTLRLRGDYLAIVTLGFGEIIRLLAERFEWLGDTRGISNIGRPPNFGPFKFGILDNDGLYWFALTVAILVYVVLRRLENSRVGRAWTAIREDEDAAELMGVPTFRFKLLAFAIGAAVGGLAGGLYASKIGFINPDGFKINLSILFLAAVVLGGSGSMPGAVLGGFLVSWMPERFRFLDTSRYMWFGIVLVVMMIFRPQGLIARRAHGRDQPPDPAPFEDVREGDPDVEGGARGALA